MNDLAERQCVPCRGGVPPLASEEIAKLLTQLDRLGSGRGAPPA